jgi:hypothetical protein
MLLNRKIGDARQQIVDKGDADLKGQNINKGVWVWIDLQIIEKMV